MYEPIQKGYELLDDTYLFGNVRSHQTACPTDTGVIQFAEPLSHLLPNISVLNVSLVCLTFH